MNEKSESKNKRILAEQRRRKILKLLEEKGGVKTSKLSSKFSVSEITIRKDLDRLEDKGKLKRTHGGAVKKESTFFEPSHDEKALVNMPEKKAIGKAVATQIDNNTTVFLSTGTTTMQVIPHLDEKKDLRVITNSLNNGYKLAESTNVNFSLIGGDFRRKSYALVGPMAEENLNDIFVDEVILGVNGISFEEGLTTPSPREAKICRKLISIAKSLVVAVDHTKFGTVVHSKIADVEEIDLLVTDDQVVEKYRKEFRELDLNWVESEIVASEMNTSNYTNKTS